MTDDVLLTRLDALVAHERESVADIVEHLSEVDRRALAIDRGFNSLWEYCVKRLRYSEGAAALRIRAARAAKYPGVLEDLRGGKVTLDSIMRLYPHMDEQNSLELLGQISGASKREVMTLVAKLDPTPPPQREVARVVVVREPEVIAPVEKLRYAFTADEDVSQMIEDLRRLRKDASLNGLFCARPCPCC